MAKTQKCTKKVRDDKTGVDFEFVNGTVVAINLDDIPEETKVQLMLHGISQKGGDSYAGTETIEDAIAALNGVRERLEKGEWTAGREGGGGKPQFTLLVEALNRATDEAVTIEMCREKVGQMDDEQQKELRGHPVIKAHLEAIKAERAAERAKKAQAEAAEAGPISI
jgi:hypothetical protein